MMAGGNHLDRQTGEFVMGAIAAAAAAGTLTLLLAYIFGRHASLIHLGKVHILSKWRGTWYHLDIERLEP